jgi:hypothetical protein
MDSNTSIDELSKPDIKIIYQHKDSFFLLEYLGEENRMDDVDKIQRIINSLIYDQLLDDLCRFKYRQLCNGDEMSMVEPVIRLYNAFKQTKNDLSKKITEDKLPFLEHILNNGCSIVSSEQQSISERIILKQIQLLNLIYNKIDLTNPIHPVKSAFKCFQMTYLKRMELVLNQDLERRKSESQRLIEQETKKGDLVGDEIKERKKKMKELELKIQHDDQELNSILKEIEQNKDKLIKLDESLAKQDSELQVEWLKLKQELELKESEYKAILLNKADKSQINNIENNLKLIQEKISELNKAREMLEKKRNKIRDDLEAVIRERDQVEQTRVECDLESKYKSNEIDNLNNEIKSLQKWSDFLAYVYDKLLNEETLFAKRARLNKRLYEEADSLLEKYNVLREEMGKFFIADELIETLSRSNTSKRREEFDKFFKKLLAIPILNVTRDKDDKSDAQLIGLNLNYSDCANVLRSYVGNELSNANLCIGESGSLSVKHEYEDCIRYDDFINDKKVCDELKEVVDRHLKAKYLFKRSIESKYMEEDLANQRSESKVESFKKDDKKARYFL